LAVTDLQQILQAGIMTTPGLAIDGQLVATGKLLKPEEIARLLQST